MPLITLGDDTKLKLKVPSKGDTGWESDFKTEFAQKIVDHDHTGVDGKGAKISEAAIEDGAITTDKIADGAITSVKIAADAVADIDLAPDSVGTSELKNDAVETANILDANVTEAKLATNSVSTLKIVDSNVTTAKIADANVTAAKIGSDVVLSTLNDVSSTSPTEQQTLVWNSSASEWKPGTTTIQNLVAGTDTYTEIGASIINIDTSSSPFAIQGDLENKIINVIGTNTLSISSESLNNITINSQSNVELKSPYVSGVVSGNPSIYKNLDIKCSAIVYVRIGYDQINPGGGSYDSIPTKIYNSNFNCVAINFNNTAPAYLTWNNSSSTNNMLIDQCSIITGILSVGTHDYPAEFYTCNILSQALYSNDGGMNIDQGTSVVTNSTNSSFALYNNFSAPSSLSTTTQYLK